MKTHRHFFLTDFFNDVAYVEEHDVKVVLIYSPGN